MTSDGSLKIVISAMCPVGADQSRVTTICLSLAIPEQAAILAARDCTRTYVVKGPAENSMSASEAPDGSTALHYPSRAAEGSGAQHVTEHERPLSGRHAARHGSSTRCLVVQGDHLFT